MSNLTLRIQRPFRQENIDVDWVSIESATGSFLIGPGHQTLISAVSASSNVVYKARGGSEEALEVGDADGLVHVVKDTVILFLR